MVRLENVLKISLQDVLKMSWRRLEDIWPRRIYWSWPRRLEDVLKTSSGDLWLRRKYSSWSRLLEDFFWRRRRKASSRRLYQDECLLGPCLSTVIGCNIFMNCFLMKNWRSWNWDFSIENVVSRVTSWTISLI